MARGEGGGRGSGMRWSVSPTRVPDWNWNWTAVRPERYIFLNILVTVRDRLVTQPCHLPATTHYVPTTLPGYVAGHGRAVPTLYVSPIYTRDFLTSSFPFSFIYIYIYKYTCPRAAHLPRVSLPRGRSLPVLLSRGKGSRSMG